MNELIKGFRELISLDTSEKSSIMPHIIGNKRLIQTIEELLQNPKNLNIVNDLKRCDCPEEILGYHIYIDKLNGNHEKRVGDYAEDLAKETGLEPEIMKQGGSVHDIGKILLPPELLNKTSELSISEKELVTYGHALCGKYIASFHPVLNVPFIKDMVIYHHDKPKGQGYPHNIFLLSGEVRGLQVADEFDLNSKDYTNGIQVVDTVHALERGVYQKIHTNEEIFKILIEKSEKGLLDSFYVDGFLRSRGLDEKEIWELKTKSLDKCA